MNYSIHHVFEAEAWAVPYHFWSALFFLFGTIVGSFLNVVIHRLPLGASIVSPPSHCPHCNYSIPWYLNIPLVTWLYLRGKCRNCSAPISVRYFLVELLTGVAFLGCWLAFGGQSVWLTLVYCLFLSGLLAASFIDLEHLIIPDEITLGGVAAGLLCSFLVPALHGQPVITESMKQGFVGGAIGAGLVYAILRAGKLLFGRQKLALTAETKVVFDETAMVLPGRKIPYEDLFYRHSDAIVLNARKVELVDRGYANARVRLSPQVLQIDEEKLNPEAVPWLEVVASDILLPREAMGLGDVKFMAAIGAFLGWQGVLFSLMASSIIGSMVGVMLILSGRKGWSSRLPYGPYIALAATIWIFGGKAWAEWIFQK